MGAMGAMMPVGWPACPSLVPELAPEPDPELQGYRACLRACLQRLLHGEGVPTSDPRVLSLTAHLTRRQAALELEEELRRRRELTNRAHRQELTADFFRGADLHYT